MWRQFKTLHSPGRILLEFVHAIYIRNVAIVIVKYIVESEDQVDGKPEGNGNAHAQYIDQNVDAILKNVADGNLEIIL